MLEAEELLLLVFLHPLDDFRATGSSRQSLKITVVQCARIVEPPEAPRYQAFKHTELSLTVPTANY